jgi:hypothetical protein
MSTVAMGQVLLRVIRFPQHLTVSFQQCCIFVLIYTLLLLESKAGKDRENKFKKKIKKKRAMLFRMSESIKSSSTRFALKGHPF